MSQDISRRNFVRNGTAGAVAAGLAGLAGCTSSLPFIGDDASFEGNAWLFAPSYSDVQDLDTLTEYVTDPELEEAELRDERGFASVVPEEILDNEDEIDGNAPVATGSGSRNKFGVPATEVDWSLSQSIRWEVDFTYTEEDYSGNTTTEEDSTEAYVSVTVHSGSFETDDVVDALERWVETDLADTVSDDEDPELESNGHEEDFDLYEVDNYAFGVHDEYLIEVDKSHETNPVDQTAVLEAAIDARGNDEDLWVDDGGDGEALLDDLDEGDKINGNLYVAQTADAQLADQYDEEEIEEWSDEFREEQEEQVMEEYDDWEVGLVGDLKSKDVDGDTTDIHEVYLYETEQDVDRETFRDAVESGRGYGDQWEFLEDYSIEVEGRAIILTGTQRTRSAF